MREHRGGGCAVPAVQIIHSQHNPVRKPYTGQRNGGNPLRQHKPVRNAAEDILRGNLETVRALQSMGTHEMEG